MKKSIILSGIFLSVIIVAIFSTQVLQTEKSTEPQNVETEIEADVFMPTKSSRPGCEKTDSCYIPSIVKINVGESVTWQNQDVAFHSVTSGSYENPNGLFDSGHLNPNQLFTWKFDKPGNYDYFCTLHPWMKGQIQVK